jgi:hypothetical protein
MTKDFTQREGIDYNETFSPVSSKDSFKIIMALMTHYDLELHQMDVKMTFLNGDLYESVYMTQPKDFVVEGKENLRYHLTKSIYFDETIRKFGFKKNDENNCIYAKFKNGKFIFLVLYVDDILLASSDVHLLLETKGFLSSHFGMKDLSEASYVLRIEIHRDRRKGVLGLSQKSYIEKVLKKFNMHKCNLTSAPIVKGVKFEKFQCPRNQYEIDKMKTVSYAFAVGCLMYAQVYARTDLAFVTGMLRRYQKNPGKPHWDGVKKALRYLQGTKGLMLTYKKSDALFEIVGYSDSDFVGCLDTEKSTS